jgi:hypothetical protein
MGRRLLPVLDETIEQRPPPPRGSGNSAIPTDRTLRAGAWVCARPSMRSMPSSEQVYARIDRLLDQVAPGWRHQPRWSRRSLLAAATGALDAGCCPRCHSRAGGRLATQRPPSLRVDHSPQGTRRQCEQADDPRLRPRPSTCHMARPVSGLARGGAVPPAVTWLRERPQLNDQVADLGSASSS